MLKQLKKFAPGQSLKAGHLNDIVDVLNALQNLTVGPGLLLTKTTSGVSVSLGNDKRQRRAAQMEELSGEPKALGQTQGGQDTDDYDRDNDAVPVKFDVVTDIKYDETTHQLTFRTRTIECSYIKSISAESEITVVTTAVPHPM